MEAWPGKQVPLLCAWQNYDVDNYLDFGCFTLFLRLLYTLDVTYQIGYPYFSLYLSVIGIIQVRISTVDLITLVFFVQNIW